MKVRRVLGTTRQYEFEDGELVAFDNVVRYKQKMKGYVTDTVLDNENVIVEKKLEKLLKKKTKRSKGDKK